MALITSCQATFQNFSGYEDDIASLEGKHPGMLL